MSVAARQRRLLAKKKAEQQALWDANDGKAPSATDEKAKPPRTTFVAKTDIKAERRSSRSSAREKGPELILSCPFCGVHLPTSEMQMHKSVHPNQVYPKIWLGGYENARDKDTLKNKLKVTHVFNCAKELANYHPKAFKYYKLFLMDREAQEMISTFDEAFKFMDKALNDDGVLFVHCQEGKSRSVTFIAAWLMNRKHYTLNNALATISSKRRIAQPNKGFREQLKKYEQHLNEVRTQEEEEEDGKVLSC